MKDSCPIAGRAVTVRGATLAAAPGRLRAALERPAGSGPAAVAGQRRRGGRPGSPRRPVRADRGFPRGAAAGRLLLPLLGVGLIALGVVIAVRSGDRSWTVSEVTQELRRIALEGGRAESASAGWLGPLRIATRSIDAATGEFVGFRIETDTVMVTAERAELQVDAAADTFAFDLRDVVFTRIPSEQESAAVAAADAQASPFGRPEAVASLVHTTDRHLFGPAPFGRDIVPDGAPRRTAGRGGSGGGTPFGPRGAAATPKGDGGAAGWLRDAGAE